ncbi:hypothetical protein KIPB_015282, partial [Kipferlia bialata]
AKQITDAMIIAVAKSIGTLVSDEDLARGHLLPPLTQIREISRVAAMALIRQAEKEGMAQEEMPSSDLQLMELIRSYQWEPAY